MILICNIFIFVVFLLFQYIFKICPRKRKKTIHSINAFSKRTEMGALSDLNAMKEQCAEESGFFVGEVFAKPFLNCISICRNSEAQTFYLANDNQVILPNKGKFNQRGFYCSTRNRTNINELDVFPFEGRCHPFASFAVKTSGVEKFHCVPKTPYFGGVLGNEILICGGALLDKDENKLYLSFIPHDVDITPLLFGKSIKHNSSFRFACFDRAKKKTLEFSELAPQIVATSEQTQANGPWHMELIFDTKRRAQSFCFQFSGQISDEVLPFVDTVANLSTGECDCEKVDLNNFFNNKSLPCSQHSLGIHKNNIKLDHTTFRDHAFRFSRPCVGASDSLPTNHATLEMCSKKNSEREETNIFSLIYPCGVDNFGSDKENRVREEPGLMFVGKDHSPFAAPFKNKKQFTITKS